MSENPYASPVEEASRPNAPPVRWGCFFMFGIITSVIGFLLSAVAIPLNHQIVLRRFLGERLTLGLQGISLMAASVGVVTLAVTALARAIWTEIDARAKTKKSKQEYKKGVRTILLT